MTGPGPAAGTPINRISAIALRAALKSRRYSAIRVSASILEPAIRESLVLLALLHLVFMLGFLLEEIDFGIL